MKKHFLLIIAAFYWISGVQAQEKFTWREEQLLRARVKQLDEFISRFNLKSTVSDNLEIPKKQAAFNQMRTEHIASLFDHEWVQKATEEQKQQATNFINQVVEGKQAQFLAYEDAKWFATTKGESIYKGKKYPTHFTMKMEKDEKDEKGLFKWSIAAVAAEFLENSQSNAEGLSPISHDLNFSKLPKAIESHKEKASSYATKDYQADLRQVFFYLVENEGLKLSPQMQKPAFHFLQVPGWIFVVEFKERNNENAGWLITKLLPATEQQKADYLKKELQL